MHFGFNINLIKKTRDNFKIHIEDCGPILRSKSDRIDLMEYIQKYYIKEFSIDPIVDYTPIDTTMKQGIHIYYITEDFIPAGDIL